MKVIVAALVTLVLSTHPQVAGAQITDAPAPSRCTQCIDEPRPLKPWIPWTVAGSGATVLLGGILLQWKSQTGMDDYENAVKEECPSGCPDGIPQHLEDNKDQALLENRVSLPLLLVGGAATITGIALLIYNIEDEPVCTSVCVTPSVGPERAGLSLETRF